jgi:ATP-dependent helicase/nuclease subunit A
VWAAARDTDVAPIRQARERARAAAEDEYRRLLYVAMTRAADRLIVCAAQGLTRPPARCWYDLVHTALAPGATEELADDGNGLVLRWRAAAPHGLAASFARASVAELAPTGLPDWLTRPCPPEAAPSPAVSPSGAIAEEPAAPAAAHPMRARALARGTLTHRLLQALPDIPPERRDGAARVFLARHADAFDADEREAMRQRVLTILDDPRFAPLFAAGSRAEVPLIGRLCRPAGEPLMVSGQVDRLAVTATAVYVADYKTNSPPPRGIEEVPPAYIAQLALYRGLLSRVFPGRPVRSLLIWTEIPALMELPEAELEAALREMIA